jgi:hypothetical protein
VKEAPSVTQEALTACATGMRQMRPMAAVTAMTLYTISDSQALGACT